MIAFKKNLKREITRNSLIARAKGVNNSMKLEGQGIKEDIAIKIALKVAKNRGYKVID